MRDISHGIGLGESLRRTSAPLFHRANGMPSPRTSNPAPRILEKVSPLQFESVVEPADGIVLLSFQK